MPLEYFSCQNFRCIASAELVLHPRFSLISGPNASGKTSLLESLAYLGRGRSFRGGSPRDLVRHGEKDFLLNGRLQVGERRHRVGVQNGQSGLQQSIDGERGGGTAGLAALLPLQVIDPEVHLLVAGPPEHRRRFLDWMTFHVEPRFLDRWRRYRRVLKQRNALLKTGSRDLDGWDKEFAELAQQVEESRQGLLAVALPRLGDVATALLETPVTFEYSRGWRQGAHLSEVLAEARGRDLDLGATQYGPHRAEIRLKVEDRLARRLVSRGQQKLLASAMVLGSVAVVSDVLGRDPLLLLDDPAAELDQAALGRLMASVGGLRGQIIATSLTADALPLPTELSRFHVEHGDLTAVK